MKNQLIQLKEHIKQTIIGQKKLIDRLLVALLSDGHILIESVPGLAKTTAVRALASGIDAEFQRIQFTPDLIPGDITGTDIFVPQRGNFQFAPGPIFHDIILADEINRAPPKVQSALLEAMQEHQVTAGGVSRPLSEIFIVIATQNPLEHEGTYPLPEAQLDRFLMKLTLDYPSTEEELNILRLEQQRLTSREQKKPLTTINKEAIIQARQAVNNIYMDEMLERYIVTLVNATRDPSPWLPEFGQCLSYGASPRATLALARAARAMAYLHERDFVEPGDIMEIAHDILNHRVALNFQARAAGLNTRGIIERIIETVPVP
jgi:MoxR-like ATPase